MSVAAYHSHISPHGIGSRGFSTRPTYQATFLRPENHLRDVLDKLRQDRAKARSHTQSGPAREGDSFVRNNIDSIISQAAEKTNEKRNANKKRVRTYGGRKATGVVCWKYFTRAFEVLASKGHRMSHVQSVMYMRMRRVQALQIFRYDLTENARLIKKLFGDDMPKQGFIATLARRSGKSFIQTTFAAALTVSQPDSNIYCYTIGGKQSTQWQEDLLKVLEKFQGTEYSWTRKQKSGLEKIVIINGIWGTSNSVSSFPVSANNGNGIIDFFIARLRHFPLSSFLFLFFLSSLLFTTPPERQIQRIEKETTEKHPLPCYCITTWDLEGVVILTKSLISLFFQPSFRERSIMLSMWN